MFDQFTLGIEEEFQIVDPHNARTAIARCRDSRRRQDAARRADQA